MTTVRHRIRPYEGQDSETVVKLSLRAWEPAFESIERVLGSEIFRRQHPDWREDQRKVVEEACSDPEIRVWVAEADGNVVGFVATRLDHPEENMGEIHLLAVDPGHQGSGLGTALTEFALDRLKEAGMSMATVETGGDPGHAPARRTYEKAGYVELPIARYFKNL